MFQFHGQYFHCSFHGIPSAVFVAEFTFTTYLLLKFYAFSTSRGQIEEASLKFERWKSSVRLRPNLAGAILVYSYVGKKYICQSLSFLLGCREIFQMRNGGEMSISASNTIVSLYCSCFPLGACIGSFSAGSSLM